MPAISPTIPGAKERTVEITSADVGVIRLRVLELGEGSPVLLLHGWPQHSGLWRGVAPLLAEAGHRAICPDLRGFGGSDAPGRGYDPENFATDAFALMDALNLDAFDLIGHDWGGACVFVMGLREPARVNHILALNTVHPWARPTPSAVAGMWRSWYAPVLATPLIGQRIAASGRIADAISSEDGISDEDAAGFTAQFDDPRRADATSKLYRSYVTAPLRAGRYRSRRLTVPTRMLFGTEDRAIPTSLIEGGLEDAGDDARTELVPGVGHFIADERPDLVAERAIRLFSGKG